MASEQMRLLIGNEFPFPVAFAFRRAMDEKDAGDALTALLRETLQFIGQLTVADYLAREIRDPRIDEALGLLLDRAPTEGTWRQWTERIIRHFAEQRIPPFLRGIAILLERSAHEDLGQLVDWLNERKHTEAAIRSGAFRTRLVRVLDRLLFLHQVPLFCPKDLRKTGPLYAIDSVWLVGDNPVFGEVECRSDLPLETQRVYAYAREPRELLCLHPFVHCAVCETCGERHFFRYSKTGHRKVLYTSIPCGHEASSADAYILLDELLRRPRDRLLHPRHLSVPGGFLNVARTLKPGERVGPYQVIELIKQGGMAQIYSVMDTRSGRTHALKLLPIEMARDRVLLVRFEEEAENLRRLSHPGVVALHDLGEDFGDHFLVLDLILGGKIGGRTCRDLSEAPKPLPEHEIIRIGKQVADALHHIHSNGIVHRDLKPGNLLVADDRVIVADFGISHARGQAKLTLTGMPVGTPEYMAPEQIEERDVDHRTDIYALGCVLYELATGRPPYRADSALAVAMCHLQSRPPSIEEMNPRISQGLANIIRKTLQKQPPLRYQSARALYEDLTRVGDDPAGRQVIAGDVTPQDTREVDRARERRRYRRRLWAIACLLPIALFGGFAGRALYTEIRIGRLLGDAETAWEFGSARWETCCDLLRALDRLGSDRPAVRALVDKIRDKGALTVETVPKGMDLELVSQGSAPDPRRFKGGERITLAPGDYTVKLLDGAGAEILHFPIRIGHLRFFPTPQGWIAKAVARGADPDALKGALPGATSGDAPSFLFAEDQEIPNVRSATVPDGWAYVNPGPFWTSGYDLGRGERIGIFPLKDSKSYEIFSFAREGKSRGFLDRGFLIAKDETTAGDYLRWDARLGDACLDWYAKVHCGFLDLVEGTRAVPIEIHRRCWRSLLAERGRDADTLETGEAILEAVFAPQLDGWRARLEKNRRATADLLRSGGPDLPARLVMRNQAIAYARTHAAIDPAEFRGWARRRSEEADRRAREVAGLIDRLGASKETLVGEGEIPEELLLGHPGRRIEEEAAECLSRRLPHPVVLAYAYWIGWRASYAAQLPLDRIRAWAVAHEEALGLDPSEIERLLGELSEPAAWLWNRDPLSGHPMAHVRLFSGFTPIVRSYADAIAKRDERPDRRHIVAWLRSVRAEEEERARRLARAAEPAGSGDDRIPWEDRLEYGWHCGWGIPAPDVFEKAFRGADDRPFPWGDVRDDLAAWYNHGAESAPQAVSKIGVMDRDRSPYDVRGLAGNVSEWVWIEGRHMHHFLSGGNYCYGWLYGVGGHIFGVEGGVFLPWAGIRVVREIRDE